MLYTSNYARKGQDKCSYAISVGLPHWYKGESLDFLAPTWEMVRGAKNDIITNQQYTEMYLDLLKERNFNAELFMEWVDSNDHDVYLLCYEKPDGFCHRRIVADYIENDIGIKVPEWLNEKEYQAMKQKIKQKALVDDLLTW